MYKTQFCVQKVAAHSNAKKYCKLFWGLGVRLLTYCPNVDSFALSHPQLEKIKQKNDFGSTCCADCAHIDD